MRFLVACSLFLCANACFAQSKTNTIDSLARVWSGGQSSPTCTSGGLDENGVPTHQCEWVPLGEDKSKVLGKVTTKRYKGDSAMVTWLRPTVSFSDSRRIIDSLDVALKQRGLAMRLCGESKDPSGVIRDRVWENATLLVHLSEVTPPVGTGEPKLIIMALNTPSSFPVAFCPRPLLRKGE